MRIPETCTAKEPAAALGRPERWVTAAARKGRFPCLKVGKSVRFTQEDGDEIYAQARRERPAMDETAEAALSWGRPLIAVQRQQQRQRRDRR